MSLTKFGNSCWHVGNKPMLQRGNVNRGKRGKRKFRVELGAFVTTMMHRTYTVSADSEEEAIEKAQDRFRRACYNSKTYQDCDSVEVDAITDIT